jgi:transposase-like protein
MSGTSSHTVCDFNVHFRQLVADSLDQDDCVIGGPGVIVELDESKLAKRKYHRGHRVDGVWILGGIERTAERRVFIEKVECRDAETLLEVISRRILPGSIVYTDMWRAYSGITERLGLVHHVVNHSIEFVNIIETEIEDDFIMVDKIHTNSIEATWCGLKLLIPKRNRTKNVEDHLWEYVWRKKNANNLWYSFTQALADVSYE